MVFTAFLPLIQIIDCVPSGNSASKPVSDTMEEVSLTQPLLTLAVLLEALLVVLFMLSQDSLFGFRLGPDVRDAS